MSECSVNESVVESAILDWLESLDWTVKHRSEIAQGEPDTGRVVGRRV